MLILEKFLPAFKVLTENYLFTDFLYEKTLVTPVKFNPISRFGLFEGNMYLIGLSEAWITADMPETAVKINRYNLCRLDRTVLIGQRPCCM